MTVAVEPSFARLSRASGIDLDAYRESHVRASVTRSIEREEADVDALADVLSADPDARSRFRRSVAVSVSGIFRDPRQFDFLESDVLPSLVEAPGRIRVWSAGCADGSELYSIAILLDRLGMLDRSFLLGSDLLEENVALARRGAYVERPTARALHARLRWERRDLAHDDPPSGRWRLIVCRNVAIYLMSRAKDALHAKLAAALAPGGILLLGRSERLSDPDGLGLAAAGPHAYRRTA